MDGKILKDLKELDERLLRVEELLGSCWRLFDEHYSEFCDKPGNYCWPYAITIVPEGSWAEYRQPPRYLSPITSAMCAWAVSKYFDPGNISSRLAGVPQEVAEKLADLQMKRLKSKTFKGESEIFLLTEVLRFLASQAQWRSDLLADLFARVKGLVDREIEGTPKAGRRKAKRARRRELHSFFLHYYVLAIEEVRRPAVKLATNVLAICELAQRLTPSAGGTGVARPTSWPSTVGLLRNVTELREALEALAATVAVVLPRSQLAQRFDGHVNRIREPVAEIGAAILDNNQQRAENALTLVQETLKECANDVCEALGELPPRIIALNPQEGADSGGRGRAPQSLARSWPLLQKVANGIRGEDWYGDALRRRLEATLLSQISYASCGDLSRLDVGNLAYALAAAIGCGALASRSPVARKALSTIFDHQSGGRWTQIQPIAATKQGTVHPPLNIEIANAVLPVLGRCSDEGLWTSWAEIDKTMDWLCATCNTVGRYTGWCTENNYATDRIDVYVTAQVVQFLSGYAELRRGLVIRSALDRAGLVPARPTRWQTLESVDLERKQDEQVKNMLRNRFVMPYQRTGKLTVSALLLYGPPGTSKTSIMDALAGKLGWQFLAISPADFLAMGGEQVEARATLIFEILRRAKGLVALFDEVDDLLLDREAKERPEGIFRFMTTSMLPKLQSLKARRNIIFGIATNYRERLDKGITRLGRVDEEWAILPPDLTSRMVLVEKFGAKRKRTITHEEARKIALNTPFFSYREMEKVIVGTEGSATEVWSVVEHPTADPRGYGGRPDSVDELRALLEALITEPVARHAEVGTRNKLKEKLRQLLHDVERLPGGRKESFEEAIQPKINALDG